MVYKSLKGNKANAFIRGEANSYIELGPTISSSKNHYDCPIQMYKILNKD